MFLLTEESTAIKLETNYLSNVHHLTLRFDKSNALPNVCWVTDSYSICYSVTSVKCGWFRFCGGFKCINLYLFLPPANGTRTIVCLVFVVYDVVSLGDMDCCLLSLFEKLNCDTLVKGNGNPENHSENISKVIYCRNTLLLLLRRLLQFSFMVCRVIGKPQK